MNYGLRMQALIGRILHVAQVAAQHPELAGVCEDKLAELQAKWAAPVTQEEMDAAWAAFEQLLDKLETQLRSGGPFVEGQEFSVADAFVIPVLMRLRRKGQEPFLGNRFAVQAYWEHVQQLPIVLKVFDQDCKVPTHPPSCRCR